MSVPRREFELPEADREYLDGLELPWETVIERANRWVIIHDWPVCSGYNYGKVSLALLIQPGYPDTQIDMVYVSPALQRSDGRGIGALSSHVISGAPWQRWSRHRTAQNPWRAGQDDLSTHLVLVDHWFKREFAGRKLTRCR